MNQQREHGLAELCSQAAVEWAGVAAGEDDERAQELSITADEVAVDFQKEEGEEAALKDGFLRLFWKASEVAEAYASGIDWGDPPKQQKARATKAARLYAKAAQTAKEVHHG